MEFLKKYGPWAVVAGASEGLGAAFASQLAARGLNVVLVARRAALTEALAATLRSDFRVEVKCLTVDLGEPAAAHQVMQGVEGLDLGFFVYNAALSPIGQFIDQRVEDNLRAIDVNVRTPTALAHHFAQRFAQRGRGGIILLSSLTAFQGSPYVATYGATKSYNLALAEGLWFELKDRGVDVLAVCAGATTTPNFLKAAPKGAVGMQSPEAVALDALHAIGHAPITIGGAFNRFASFLMRRLMPRATTIAIMGNQTKRLQLPP
jgi:uncharacterized protein